MNALSDAAIMEEIARVERQLAHLRIVAQMRSAITAPTRCSRMASVIGAAARAFNMPATWIMGQNQSKEVCRARFAVMWAARNAFAISTPQIGKALDHRDHTTIMSGIKRADTLRGEDDEFRAITDGLLETFAPQFLEEAENAQSSH